MSSELKPGIYVESKGVSGGLSGPEGLMEYKHLYFVYRRANGTTEVIRGGSSAGIIGVLNVETGKSLDESADKYLENDTRLSKRLKIDEKDLENEWTAMRLEAEHIGKAELKYDSMLPGDKVPEQNSNSVIRYILEKRGYDSMQSLPEGILERDVPGFENNLKDPIYLDSQSMGDPSAENDKTGGAPAETADASPKGTDTGDAGAGDARKGSGLAAEAGRKDIADAAPVNLIFKELGKTEQTGPSEEARAKALAIVSQDDTLKGGDSLDTLMLKPVETLTEAEAKNLGEWSLKLPGHDPRRQEIENRRREFYVANYGTDPVENDATGRMIQPKPKRALPETETPLKSPNGQPVADALKRFAGILAPVVEADGETPVVRAVQAGLGMLGEKLKVDGAAGQKTRAALTRVAAKHGPGKLDEAFGLGRFQQYAANERNRSGAASDLKQTVETTVQPLFGTDKPKVAAEALQESLNDLGAKSAQVGNRPLPEPLKIDGDIGPKTTDAFRLALAEHGPDTLTRSYHQSLGFVG